jgi:hypothetical protein
VAAWTAADRFPGHDSCHIDLSFLAQRLQVTRKARYEDIVVIDLETFVHPLKIEWMS